MMTTTFKSFNKLVLGVALGMALTLLANQSALAVPVETEEANNSAAGFDGDIATNLITAGQSSLAGVTYGRSPDGGFQQAGLNDNMALGTVVADFPAAQNTLTWYDNLHTTPAEVTFDLSGAYDITSVRALSGWGDSYFGSHQFTLSFEYGDSGTFVPVGSFGTSAYTPAAPPPNPEVASDGFSTRTTVTDTLGLLGSNVTGVRFLFTDPYPELAGLNGSVLRELSVTGAPVPEPATLALLATALPLAGLGWLRRRRK